MKIEKINDNQIKCILNKNDLLARNLNVSELAYGSEKANFLFREMTEEAFRKFGFQIDNTPLMVEAIPLPNESIALILTKVDDPEELDTRFSKFTPTKDDLANIESSSNASEDSKINKANEILNLLSTFREALADSVGLSATSHIKQPDKKKSEDIEAETEAASPQNIALIFAFEDIDKIISLAKVLHSKYHGQNSIYQKDTLYYLLVNKSDHTPEEFNQICNILCEFGDRTNMNIYSEAYLAEHCELILKDNALTELASIE